MTSKTRRTRDEYMMANARVAAAMATCTRKKVGCVVAIDGKVRATGYNGSLPGEAHCDEIGCLVEDDHCVRTTHAEANAIAQAARAGVSLNGGTLYVTASPCFTCFKLLASSGVTRVVFGEFYRDSNIFEFAKSQNIRLVDGSKLRKLGIRV